MLDILVLVAIVLALAVAALLGFAAMRPDTFTVQRSTTINAPADRIFPLISDLRAMNTWNPFVEPDPNIKLTYSGPASGKGAIHEWNGNRNVGEGSLEVLDVTVPTRLTARLLMRKPMKADNKVEFTLQPQGPSTAVTWQMSGRQPLIGKVMTLFIDCDRMVGSQFEKGLAKLKSIVEKPAA